MADNTTDTAPRPKCKYWNKCFRADKKHLAQFLHPGEELDNEPEDTVTMGGASKAGTHTTGKTQNINLAGKTVMFVGTFRKLTEKGASAQAIAYGCTVVTEVDEDVDIIVVGEDGGRKAQKAKDLALRIVTEAYWNSLVSRAKQATSSKTDVLSPGKPKRQPSKTKLQRQRTHNVSDDSDGEGGSSRPPIRRTRSNTSLGGDATTALGGAPSNKKRVTPKAHPESDMDTSDENEAVVKGITKRPLPDDEATPRPKRQKSTTAADTVAAASTSKTATASPPKTQKKVAKCKYWDKCYQKGKAHSDMFLHPGDDPSELADDGPQTLDDGEEAQVEAGVRKFTIKRLGKVYSCNCVGWKTQTKAADKKTCKHLKEYLGEDVECKRTGAKPTVVTPNKGGQATVFRAPRHKSVSVLLAQKYTDDKDPTGWWISEKLDGVRAYWDGKTFFSRLGNEFIPPPWFIKNYPSDMTLDGELFGGRAQFQSTVAIVKNAGSSRWKELEYHIFDAPSIGREPFEQRVKKITEYFEKNASETAVVVEHKKCTGRKMIKDDLDKVEELGGEGLMIREPKSQYEEKRSYTLLKIKNFYDAEAVVIAYEQGKGRNAGRVGALRCRMECGKEFSVGSGLSDKERNSPPKKGAIITYKFQEYTNSGSPRFPTFIGVRIDASGPKDAVLPAGKLQAGGKK